MIYLATTNWKKAGIDYKQKEKNLETKCISRH